MKVEKNLLSAKEFCEIFESVGWQAPCMEQIEIALANSVVVFCVYDGETAVGMARLLGDGGMSFYIKDFAVRPEYQGRGVGRLLMETIEAYIDSKLQNGWAVSLELISAKGKEEFYKKFNFEERPCEWDGAGMFKMLRKES
ncbi:MAG: GNAT family N-acetyltransferase [Lachnospiraceae bacterium]